MHLKTGAGVETFITDVDGDGDITFSGTFGSFILNLHSGLSKPALGTAAVPHMDLTFRASSTITDTLLVEISDQGFSTSPLAMAAKIGGTLSGGITSVKADATFDSGNVLFGGAAPPGYTQTFTTGSFAGTGGFQVTGATPYSLTQRILITATGAGLTSGDFEINAVPAPAGLVLALSATPVLGIGAWLRRRKAVVG